MEEDVDSQVKEVELRVKQKAKEDVEAERKSMRELMKGEMEELQSHLSMFEKVRALLLCIQLPHHSLGGNMTLTNGQVDSWLKSNPNNLNEEKVNEIRTKLEDSIRESRQLKLSLIDTQTNVALMRTELAQLRTQYEEKCRELTSEMGKVAQQNTDQQQLHRQLLLLQYCFNNLSENFDRYCSEISKVVPPGYNWRYST